MSRHSNDHASDGEGESTPEDDRPRAASEPFLDRLLRHHPEGLLAVDRSGTIVRANPAFARLVGHDPDALRDRPVGEVLVDGDDGPVGDNESPTTDGESPTTGGIPLAVFESESGTDADTAADADDFDASDERVRSVRARHADGHDLAVSIAVVDRTRATTTVAVTLEGEMSGSDRDSVDTALPRMGATESDDAPQPADATDDADPTDAIGNTDASATTDDETAEPTADSTDATDSGDSADGGRERNLRAYEAVVESMADGVVVFGPEGTVRIANETFARPLGYAPADLVGEPVATLRADGVLPASAFEDWRENLRAARSTDAGQRRFETRLETVRGERRFEVVLTRLPTGEADVVAVVRDVTAKHERDRRLEALHEAARDLMTADSAGTIAETVVEAAQTILDIPIAAVRLRTDDDRLDLAAWTDETEAQLGVDRTYAVGEGLVGRAFAARETAVYDDLSRVETEYDRAGIESTAYLPIGDHGIVSLGATEIDGFDETDVHLATLLATSAASAIERAERTRRLEALYDTTRRLMQAESPATVASLAVETARDVLDFPLTGVWLYDEDTEVLEPVATPPDVEERFEEVPTYAPGNSLSWRAFATGEWAVHDDLAATPGTYTETPTIGSEIVVPLGSHGVLNVGSTSADAFDDEAVYFARALAANTEAALDRAAREDEIATQRDELATLARVNSVIQAILRELTGAATREEIERIVCERFADSERYRFAWIGEHDPADERMVPRTATDRAADYLDTVEIPTGEDAPEGPSRRAARTGEVAVSQDVRTDPDFEAWREQAGEFDYRSTAAVPLRHEQVTYGQLAVYAIEPDAFGEREREALSVLGETVGFALNAARNIQLLRGNSVTELDLRAPETATLLGVLATRLDATVALDSVVPSGEGTLQYLSIEGASEADVADALADAAALPCAADVGEWRAIDSHDSGCRLELATTGSVIETLVAAGVTVATAVADDEGVRIVAEAAPDADVRSIVDTVRGVNPAIELRAKRQTDRPVRTTDEFRDRIQETLTERQGTALRAAYAAGYYDWPRESTAEEVAESMGIASPTLHSHLRKAQSTVLDALFDEGSE